MSGLDSNSQYFTVGGRGKKDYKVTINYGQGNWCTCMGMISKKGTWGEDAGKTQGTSCKHIKQIIDKRFGGDWGTKNPDGSRTPKTRQRRARASQMPDSKPIGRRAAIMATRAKFAREEANKASDSGDSLMDRIVSLEAKRG